MLCLLIRRAELYVPSKNPPEIIVYLTEGCWVGLETSANSRQPSGSLCTTLLPARTSRQPVQVRLCIVQNPSLSIHFIAGDF